MTKQIYVIQRDECVIHQNNHTELVWSNILDQVYVDEKAAMREIVDRSDIDGVFGTTGTKKNGNCKTVYRLRALQLNEGDK